VKPKLGAVDFVMDLWKDEQARRRHEQALPPNKKPAASDEAPRKTNSKLSDVKEPSKRVYKARR
jgi:hypothetical protein